MIITEMWSDPGKLTRQVNSAKVIAFEPLTLSWQTSLLFYASDTCTRSCMGL